MDCIWVNLKNVDQPFLQVYLSLYQNFISQLENHSHSLLRGRDFANETLFLYQFDV